MSAPYGKPPEAPELTRRDFLTKGVRNRVRALLGGGAAVGESATVEGDERVAAAAFTPDDLRLQTRDGVRAALDGFRARRAVS